MLEQGEEMKEKESQRKKENKEKRVTFPVGDHENSEVCMHFFTTSTGMVKAFEITPGGSRW